MTCTGNICLKNKKNVKVDKSQLGLHKLTECCKLSLHRFPACSVLLTVLTLTVWNSLKFPHRQLSPEGLAGCWCKTASELVRMTTWGRRRAREQHSTEAAPFTTRPDRSQTKLNDATEKHTEHSLTTENKNPTVPMAILKRRGKKFCVT